MPEMYRNSITAELTAYIINKGADVISSGCIYNDIPPLKFAEKYGYGEEVVKLIKDAIEKQSVNKTTKKKINKMSFINSVY